MKNKTLKNVTVENATVENGKLLLEINSTSKSNGIKVRIGFLGPEGTFSQEAARQIWRCISFSGSVSCELVSFDTPHELKVGLFEKVIEFAVIPVKNSITGPVNSFLKEFHPLSNFDILHSFRLPVHHCLFKLPDMDIKALRFVSSHPQALLQTAKTRSSNPLLCMLKECTAESTGAAASALVEGILPSTATVICSKETGLARGLELVFKNIEDDPSNATTFLLLKK